MAAAQRSTTDVAVIGGGPVGLAVAWRAAQSGFRVVVLERAPRAPAAGAAPAVPPRAETPGAFRVAAGMLAPVSEATFGEEALLRLALAAAEGYARFAGELAEASGRDPGHRACGTLLIARDRDAAEALERDLAFRRRLGLEVQRLRPSEARRLERALAPTVRLAAHVPGDHAIDPRLLVLALGEAVVRAGGEIRHGAEVTRVHCSGGAVTGVELAGGEELAAGRVVVAAGCWSGLLDGIPKAAALPLRPVKGQLLRLRDPAGPGLVTRVLRSEDVYLVPRPDGRYVLGGTVEERGWDTAITAGAAQELLRAGFELVPGVAELEVEEALAGLRPATPDNAPAIGAGAVDGLVWATGHYRNGILLAPLTGTAVAGLLAEGEVPEIVRPFAPGRFRAPVAAA